MDCNLLISSFFSITGKTGINIEFPSVIIKGTEAREIIAHRLSFLLFAIGFILYCMISTCIIYNKGFFIQLKRLRVFLFSKYFLNPNIYYRAYIIEPILYSHFYTTKKRTIVVVIISSTECSFLYQLFYYTFLPRLNSK